MYDLNDAQPQMAPVGDLIPDGTFAKVKMTIRPGGTNGSTPIDAGLLKASQSSDAKLLDCEFTVVAGPYARRKFWQNFTVAGGKLDEKGQSKGWNISKATFRAMVDSALGLDPRDESAAAKAKRVFQGLKQLDGIVVAARIMVEPASDPQYRDANKLATSSCRASRNTTRSCAARPCSPIRSTPSRAKRRTARRSMLLPGSPTRRRMAACPGPTRISPAHLSLLRRPVRPGSIPEAGGRDR
jgi:hypothetical protein